MPITSIWFRNYHQIRSYVGRNFCFRILKSHATFFSEKQLHYRMCSLQSLAAKIQQCSQSSGSINSCDIKNDKKRWSNFPDCKTSQLFSNQKISGEMVSNRPATLLVLDIETTRLSRKKGRIIEIAIRDLNGGKNSTFQTLINPRCAILNTRIHGISYYMVNKPEIPSFDELVPMLMHYINSRRRNGRPVLWVAHFGRTFDFPFLISEFKRCSVEIPDDWLFLDTRNLASQLRNPDGSNLKSISLEALCKHFGISLEGPAHRAMTDVNALASVVQRITCELKITVPELLQIALQPSDISK